MVLQRGYEKQESQEIVARKPDGNFTFVATSAPCSISRSRFLDSTFRIAWRCFRVASLGPTMSITKLQYVTVLGRFTISLLLTIWYFYSLRASYLPIQGTGKSRRSPDTLDK